MRARQSARGTGTCTTAPTIGPVWPERISRDPAVTKTVHNLCPGIPSLKVYRFGFALSYSDVSSRRRHASSVDLRAVPQERHASRQPLTGHALHGLSSVRPITHAWNGLTPTRLVVVPAPGAQRHGGHHEEAPDVASVHGPSRDRGRGSSVRRGTQVLGRSARAVVSRRARRSTMSVS
jgi:hypothetical protein